MISSLVINSYASSNILIIFESSSISSSLASTFNTSLFTTVIRIGTKLKISLKIWYSDSEQNNESSNCGIVVLKNMSDFFSS